MQDGLEVRAWEATRKSPDRAAAGALGVGCPVGFMQQREAAGHLRQPVVTWRQVRSQAPSPLWLQDSPEFTSLRGELPLPQLLRLSVRPSLPAPCSGRAATTPLRVLQRPWGGSAVRAAPQPRRGEVVAVSLAPGASDLSLSLHPAAGCSCPLDSLSFPPTRPCQRAGNSVSLSIPFLSN